MKLDFARTLIEHGFYVFPIVEGGKAPPRMAGWQRFATRDIHKAQAMWASHPGDNIGISTSHRLLVVDVDPAKGGNESLLALELAGFDLPPTCTQRTARGGQHLIYSVAKAVKQGVDVLGAGLDIRSKGGYIVAAGSTTADGEYVMDATPVAPAPAWLIEKCGEAREKPAAPAAPVAAPSAPDRAVHYLKFESPCGGEGSRNDTGFKVAARCKDLGCDEPTTLALMAEHWPCVPALDDAELAHVVHSAYRYGDAAIGSAAPEADFKPVLNSGTIVPNSGTFVAKTDVDLQHPFDKLNATYAFCVAGGGSHILFETTDHRGTYKLEHLASGTFHAKHAAEVIQVGKRSSPITEEWMRWKGRRSYDGLVFMPGQEAPSRFYNLWRGFAYEPASGSHPAVDAFLEHARDNVCRGDGELFRWLIGYFAHLVQRPWEKPLVALVFRGGKGIGKNALIERIGTLLGGHFLVTSNRRYLVGNFNGHLENLLFFALDEAFWSGDKQAEGQLKDLITGNHHVIEHKGKEPYTVANCTRVAIIGNEDWLVPASHDERRFAVFDVGDGRKQDRGFFQAMREGMEGGGYRVLLRHLLDFNLTGFDINEAPVTQGLADQKTASLDAFTGWWLTCLHDGKLVGGDFDTAWPQEVERERFRSAYRRYAKERNVRSWMLDDRAIGHKLKGFAPGVTAGRLQAGHTYKIPSLEQARAEWAKFIGHPVAWE